MERRQIRFHGRVQGVGFRATTRAVASDFRVSGWVRNEPDGSVLAEVQGDLAALDAFTTALQERMRSYIASIDVAPRDVVRSETDFRIQR